MQGIIFNTIEDFNILNNSLHTFVQNNTLDYQAPNWTNALVGSDNTFLMTGISDKRLIGFDFSNYTIEEIENSNIIYFPEQE